MFMFMMKMKTNVMKSVGKQIEIIKKQKKSRIRKDDKKVRQQKETRTETYIKDSHFQTIQ